MQIPFSRMLAILAIFAALIGIYVVSRTSSQASVARDVVEKCAEEKYRPSCYEREVPKLYPAMSLKEVFALIRDIRELDTSYQFCHVLAHKLGEKVTAEDPEAWIDAIPLNPPDGMCSNGFIHGVVGGRFRAEVLDSSTVVELVPDFRRACEARKGWNPSNLDRAICYHGMGHLFLFITDGNIERALDICERTTDEYNRRVCVQGVFMQIYQPLEPDDFALIEKLKVKPEKETVRSMCAAYGKNPLYEGSCLQESWPLFRTEILAGTGVVPFCSDYPTPAEESQCYVTVSAVIGRMSLGNQKQAIAACSEVPDERKAICFGNAAQSALEEDRTDAISAISLCESAQEFENACLRTLIDHARFIFGNDAHAHGAFCDALPAAVRGECGRAW